MHEAQPGQRQPPALVNLKSLLNRQHDRFVLICLGWLYGRGEFPLPMSCPFQ